MIKFIKALALLLAVILTVGALSLSVYAEDANVTYTGNSGRIVFEPGSEHSPTDLFANFKDVMPGAELTQKIHVSNKADDRVKVKLYIRSLGSTDEAYNEFLEQLTLTVAEETDTPMFDAAAHETAGLTDWVCLGTLYSGGSLDLNVTLKVPTTLDNKFKNLIGKIKWQIAVEEFPIYGPVWKCPNNEKHDYHIEEIDGVSTFVCDDCPDSSEPMKCDTCGDEMHEVMIVIIGGKTHKTYPDGEKHYKTEDDSVHFYMNDDVIIDYYVEDGTKTDIKDVDEYILYTYYECCGDENHHTDPVRPQTGDISHTVLWAVLAGASAVAIVILIIFAKRKKEDEEDNA